MAGNLRRYIHNTNGLPGLWDDGKREEGVKLTMVHLTTAVLARAIAFDVPEMNCFIRRGAVVGREHLDVMLPVQVGGDAGVTPAIMWYAVTGPNG